MSTVCVCGRGQVLLMLWDCMCYVNVMSSEVTVCVIVCVCVCVITFENMFENKDGMVCPISDKGHV